MTQRLSRAVFTATAAVLLIASCDRDTPPKGPEPWDDNNHTSVRWIPNPAADLMSPEGTFIRAATESWDRAWIGQGHGLDAIKSAGYPGFEHAFNNVWKPEEVGGHARRSRPIVGTSYSEIVALSREGDRSKAAVCSYTSQTAGQLEDGKYSGPGSKPTEAGAWLTFGPDPKLAADQQHSPPANQRGPSERPTDNVFGTWVILDIDFGARTPVPAQCAKFAPGTPTNLPNPEKVTVPPPTLSPDPGWPAGSKA